MSDHLIRIARAEDAAALHTLAAATFPLACPPHTTPDAIAHFITTILSVDRFTEYLADPDHLVLVADVDGALVGYTMLVFGEPHDPDAATVVTTRPVAELSKCYVIPDHQGTGLAAALVEASVEAARERGSVAVWLGVNEENVRANAFYEKRGFAVAGTKRFLVGKRYEDDFVRLRAL